MIYLIYFIIGIFSIIIIQYLFNSNKNKNKLLFELDHKNLTNNYLIKKNGFNIIDHIYILNLKKNKNKKILVKNMFLKTLGYKIEEDNIFYGFFGKNIKDSFKSLISKKILHEDYKYYFPYKPIFFNVWKSYGCLGHYISFYQIFNNAKYNNLKYFMIVEDDSVFNDKMKTILPKLLNFFITNDIDFISLGQSNTFYKHNKKLLNSNKFKYENSKFKFFDIEDSNYLFQQTHTMIFKTSSLDVILNEYFPQKCPTDVMIGNLSRNFKTDIRNNIFNTESKSNKKLNGLFCYPPLSKQREDNISDIDVVSFLDYLPG
jgi:GR25 family glycosyltransferase involved in LPS biosynthesis